MNNNINDMMDLIRLKKSSPEDYKEILKTYKEVTKDLMKMSMEISKEIIEEMGKNESDTMY